MMFACKCQNFVAHKESIADCTGDWVKKALLSAFLERFSKISSPYSSICADFLINAHCSLLYMDVTIKHSGLLYGITMDVVESPRSTSNPESWQLVICINCNTVICARRIDLQPTAYLINDNLETNLEKVMQIREDSKNFSQTFQILIFNTHETTISTDSRISNVDNLKTLNSQFELAFHAMKNTDDRNLRLRYLQVYGQERMKREIFETNERIQQYTETQFALLNEFQKKTEYDLMCLANLIRQIPDEIRECFDEKPPEIHNCSNSTSNVIDICRNTVNLSNVLNENVKDVLISVIEAKSIKKTQNEGSSASELDTPPPTPENFSINSNGVTLFDQGSQETKEILNTNAHFCQQFPASEDENSFFMDDVFSDDNEYSYSDKYYDEEEVDGDNDDDDDAVKEAITMDYSLPKTIPIKTTDNSLLLLGRSLPIPMPTLQKNNQKEDLEQYIVDKNERRRIDIGASIRALAKSVHGEAIFGDLPRPRLRSEI